MKRGNPMPDKIGPEQESSPEFQRFDAFMKKMVNVPISEVRKLDTEQKRAKKAKGDLGVEGKK
jgi:hypothetical protein